MIDHQKLRSAVVHLQCERCRGTGFFVARDHLLTAYHVIEQAETIEVKTSGGKKFSASLVADGFCKESDFALLKVDWESTTTLPTGGLRADEIAVGEKGTSYDACGFPYDDDFRILTGKVGLVEESRIQLFAEQLAASSAEKPEGFSGGPVVVGSRVVGIVRGYRARGKGTAGGMFDACPMLSVLENKVCFELLADSYLEEARKNAKKSIAKLLGEREELFRELKSALDVGSDIEHPEVEIADKLVEGGARRSISVLQECLTSFRSRRAEASASRGVRDLYCRLLPVFEESRQAISTLRKELASNGKATTEAASNAYAEVLMAGADGRGCAFVLRPGGLVGAGMIPLASEGGIDLSGARFADAVLDHLSRKLYVAKTSGQVQGALLSIREADNPNYPPYFLAMRQEEYKLNKPKVDELLSTLKALRLILLCGGEDEDVNETLMIHPVIRLFAEDQKGRGD